MSVAVEDKNNHGFFVEEDVLLDLDIRYGVEASSLVTVSGADDVAALLHLNFLPPTSRHHRKREARIQHRNDP